MLTASEFVILTVELAVTAKPPAYDWVGTNAPLLNESAELGIVVSTLPVSVPLYSTNSP